MTTERAQREALRPLCERALLAHPDAAARWLATNDQNDPHKRALTEPLRMVMREIGGRTNPALVMEVLAEVVGSPSHRKAAGPGLAALEANLEPEGSKPTLNPFEYKGSEEYPYGIYNGHELTRADMHTVYAVGGTPREAIEAFCRARQLAFESLGEALVGGNPAYTWGYRFRADGTGCKAAGIHVPGGVILTWWK